MSLCGIILTELIKIAIILITLLASEMKWYLMGRVSGSWGKLTEIYHDGTDGYVGTKSGGLVLEPDSGNVNIDGNPAFSDQSIQSTAAKFPSPAYDSGWVYIANQ